jgi:hypothetical protein
VRKSLLNNWENIRKQGRKSFIIKTGILRFGLPVGIAMAIYIYIFTFMKINKSHVVSALFALYALILSIPAGITYGIWIWKKTEKKFKKRNSENAAGLGT